MIVYFWGKFQETPLYQENKTIIDPYVTSIIDTIAQMKIAETWANWSLKEKIFAGIAGIVLVHIVKKRPIVIPIVIGICFTIYAFQVGKLPGISFGIIKASPLQ